MDSTVEGGKVEPVGGISGDYECKVVSILRPVWLRIVP